MAVSFDLFGTLVSVERPDDPAAAVAAELRERGIAVPDDWEAAYREPHLDVAEAREVPLPDHVRAALESQGIEPGEEVGAAVLAAFDADPEVRSGAREAIRAASEAGSVGVLSNCSVPGLVDRALERAGLAGEFDAVVTSVGCGWRKPHPRAFEVVADRLGVEVVDLRHVGDDPRTDGGAEDAGATAILIEDGLEGLPDRLGGTACP